MTSALPLNPLPSLADEIVSALARLTQRHPEGPGLKTIAAMLGADAASVRRAARDLNAAGRADLMRRSRSREFFLVPLNYRKAQGLNVCVVCASLFERQRHGTHYSDRRTCSRFCWSSLGWQDSASVAKRKAAISAAHSTPAALARTAAHNKRRWSRPEEHQRLSEQNRREWADPVKGKLRAQSIAAVNGSPRMRKFYSDLRKEWWKDPVMRKKMYDAATASQKTQAYRAKLSTLAKKRWADPAWRKKLLAAVRRNSLKGAAATRGKRQSPEHVRKRVEARASKRACSP